MGDGVTVGHVPVRVMTNCIGVTLRRHDMEHPLDGNRVCSICEHPILPPYDDTYTLHGVEYLDVCMFLECRKAFENELTDEED